MTPESMLRKLLLCGSFGCTNSEPSRNSKANTAQGSVGYADGLLLAKTSLIIDCDANVLPTHQSLFLAMGVAVSSGAMRWKLACAMLWLNNHVPQSVLIGALDKPLSRERRADLL